MIKMKKDKASLIVLLQLAALLAGCSNSGSVAPKNGSEAAKEAQVSTEPVTLTAFNTGMAKDAFQSIFVDSIQKKYPYITVKPIHNEKGTTLDDLIAAGTIPDIIFGNYSDIEYHKQRQLLIDLTPFISKYKYDLDRFDPVIINTAKIYSGEGKLLGIPNDINPGALYYNKDIFYMLGVPYPKDGMTWEETLDIVKQLNKGKGTVPYRAFDFLSNNYILSNQLSLPLIDTKTDKAAVYNEKWKLWFDTMKAFYEVDGNKVTDSTVGKEYNDFMENRNLAMIAHLNLLNRLPAAASKGLNWDMVTLPSFPGAPNTGLQAFPSFVGITPTSKYKDQAFQAITHLESDEMQIGDKKIIRITVLNSETVKKEQFNGPEQLKGKNYIALVKPKIAEPAMVSKYDSIASRIMNAKFKDVITGKKDVNTALREADEEINKAITVEKSK
jgi:multiple sugar transport system substrate-binding protein